MPSLASSASPASDWTTSTSPKNASVTASAGNLILVFGGTEGFGTTVNTPSDGTNTYTALMSFAASGYSSGYAWSTGIIGVLAVTTTSLPGATSGVAYTATLTASGGTGSGQAWTVVSGALPGWASLSAAGVISGTPDAVTGTFSFTVQVTDSGANTATQPLSIAVSSGSVQPVGPGGTWVLKFADVFPGSTLDATKWATPNGISNSATTTDSSKVSVSGGYCQILHSGMINSQPSLQGWGANPNPGVTLNVGDCCEASINIPGSGGSSQYNWPAWWVSGASWPANGEEDIVEGYDSSLSALNYHNPSGANNGPHPSGNYVNSFHTYTLVRGSTTLQCWWDGTLVRSVARSDSGGPQSLIVYNAGDGTQGPLNTVLPIQVDYVRVWSPG